MPPPGAYLAPHPPTLTWSCRSCCQDCVDSAHLGGGKVPETGGEVSGKSTS